MTAAESRKLNKDAGFSLLELLIAVVILAIIVIPLLNLFLSSNRLNIKSRQTLRATTAAQDIMEGLKAYNIEEIKEQFDKPADGFYVIDSRLIKGGVKEEDALEKDPSGNLIPGLYVFSMKDVNMQGSKFDAKIVVDGREYRTDTSTGSPDTHDKKFNDAALADARSIDKKNGTFVETEKIRHAMLTSVFEDGDMKTAIKEKLLAGAADVEKAYADLRKADEPSYIGFKNLTTHFAKVSRTIKIELENSTEKDKNNHFMVVMKVTETYEFTYRDKNGADVKVTTSGYMGENVMVSDMPCGKITRMVDEAGKEEINVNLFYYPLYGYGSGSDKIVIDNKSGADINLLIAKQRYEKEKDDPMNPGKKVPDLTDPEYFTDPQLMAAEQLYHVEVEIKNSDSGTAIPKDNFSLKTNLGLNLVGEKYAGPSIELPGQFTVNGTAMDLSGTSDMNIFTLDGVRSPMGRPSGPGEATELIYDVEVSLYEMGAAVNGFPDDKRMVVIGGSMTN